jgi:hypothetical protein
MPLNATNQLLCKRADAWQRVALVAWRIQRTIQLVRRLFVLMTEILEDTHIIVKNGPVHCPRSLA